MVEGSFNDGFTITVDPPICGSYIESRSVGGDGGGGDGTGPGNIDFVIQ